MGIRGLLWFTKTQPNAYYDVDIRQLGAAKRREGKDPVILVDVQNCGNFLYGDLDWMCGGQYKEYLERLQQFVDSFQNAGIRVIMIIDGTCQDDKRPVWIKRRYEKLQNSVYPVFDYLRKQKRDQLFKKFKQRSV